jgi:hypothetical protein
MKRENKGVYKISYNNCKETLWRTFGGGGVGRGYDCRAVLINLGKYVGEGRARGSLLLYPLWLFLGYSPVIPRYFNFGFFFTGSLAKLAALPGEE